jgi:hypothetical protein
MACPGANDRRRQHGAVAFDAAVAALSRLAAGAADVLRAEIFGSVQSDQRAAAEALKRPHSLMGAQCRDDLVESRLQE